VPVGALPDGVSAQFPDEAKKPDVARQNGTTSAGARAAAKRRPSSGSKYTVLLIEDNAPFVPP